MMRRGFIFWSALLLVAFIGIYQLKYQVRELRRDTISLRTEVEEEYRSLHILRAEWAYLTRPERLAQLNERHLKLEKLKPGQLMSEDMLDAVPDRLNAEPAVAETGHGG